jgi:hypothetical protein
MLSAEFVRDTLYNFTMYAFSDFNADTKKTPFKQKAWNSVLEMLETESFITAEEATMLPKKKKKALHDIIIAYITFLSLPDWPPFPQDFLDGSSERKLNTPILRYMRTHSDQILDYYRQAHGY